MSSTRPSASSAPHRTLTSALRTSAEVTQKLKQLVQQATGQPFPTDVKQQLELAIKAVFNSWMGKRAVDYRNEFRIPHDLGTAVNVVAMVFGNMGDDSGTGVAFTRDPSTGSKALFGEFLPNAQGEDVVAGIRTPLPISRMQEVWPSVYGEFQQIADRLEHTYKDVQDLEFTVERGKLYMLQTRNAKRTARAAVVTAVQMVEEGLISKEEALTRVEPSQIQQLLVPQFDPRCARGGHVSALARGWRRRLARPSASWSSTRIPPSSGPARVSQSSWRAARRRPRTSTGWPARPASSHRAAG